MQGLANRILKIGKHPIAVLAAVLFTGEAWSQNWSDLPNMQRERFESSAVQFNDDIYVFNGFGQSIRIEPTVEKFDAATQTWSIIGSTSVVLGNAVTHNGIVRIGNEAWIIGGRKGSHPGQVSNQVWKYNLTSGSWTAGPGTPQPVAAGGAALVNNNIHWFGGIDPQANCDSANHYVYNLNQPSTGWQNITGHAAMPSPRNHFATAVLNGWIYAIGGQYGHDSCPGRAGQDTNLVHAFNPNTNQWVQKASLPEVQSHMEPSTFVYHGAIYVIGGEQNGNKIYRYNAAQDDWDTVGTLPENLVAPVARVIDDKLIVASGGAPNAFSPTSVTRSTDMTPLILPGSQPDTSDDNANENTDDEQSNTPISEIQEDESYISIEAEYYDTNSTTATHIWHTTSLSNSSNDAAVVTSPDSGALTPNANNSPGLGYLVIFDKPGTWYVWLRGWGNTNSFGEGSSDSIHAGLNGQLSITADNIDYFPADWNWSNSTRDNARATITIPSAGVHTFNLWMREDGLAIDKVLLTTDSNYTPTGNGPENTDSSATEDDSSDNSAPVQQCNGLTVTINIGLGQQPTLGDDVILGTSGDDTINAMGGNDTICALEGNDTVNAGNGLDWIDAGPGNDIVNGGNDSDLIYGDTGIDTLNGGPGNDEIFGEDDNDFINGNAGNDSIDGGHGIDQLIGGSGNDVIETGTGGNRETGLVVDGGDGNDTITGGSGDDEIRGATGNDIINGATGNDALFGGGGNDTINGHAGDDTIRGNGSNDTITGGNGADDIDGGSGDDIIYGGSDSDFISGSTGNDFLFGGEHNDVIYGGGGADTLYGNRGNDSLFGGGSNDNLNGGSDTDSCDGENGSDTTTGCETGS